MRNDLKKGMITGAVISIIAALVVSIWPSRKPHTSSLQDYSSSSPVEPSVKTEISSTPATLPKSAVEPDTAKAVQPSQIIHVVSEGQTLSSIAYDYYGDTTEWRKILDANYDILPDQNKLRPGMKLVIPK